MWRTRDKSRALSRACTWQSQLLPAVPNNTWISHLGLGCSQEICLRHDKTFCHCVIVGVSQVARSRAGHLLFGLLGAQIGALFSNFGRASCQFFSASPALDRIRCATQFSDQFYAWPALVQEVLPIGKQSTEHYDDNDDEEDEDDDSESDHDDEVSGVFCRLVSV